MTYDPDLFRALLTVIGRALDDLDVVAHNPVQGMAMHKVIAARLMEELPAAGYELHRAHGHASGALPEEPS